jgi:hypothetical protein
VREFLLVVLVRPALFGAWSLATWGGILWSLLVWRACDLGVDSAVESLAELALLSKLSMALAVLGAVVAFRVGQLQRDRRRARQELAHVGGRRREAGRE